MTRETWTACQLISPLDALDAGSFEKASAI
jgi:hypothetical protein